MSNPFPCLQHAGRKRPAHLEGVLISDGRKRQPGCALHRTWLAFVQQHATRKLRAGVVGVVARRTQWPGKGKHPKNALWHNVLTPQVCNYQGYYKTLDVGFSSGVVFGFQDVNFKS